MANPLTGDYNAVLQVSGSTVDRLMASIHQNVDAKPPLPSFPHSTTLRLGDDEVIDGVKGSLWAQVGVPRIELIHGADDRFGVEVGIRGRYVPDAGSEPLPEFINGNVRAEYQLWDIDPSCAGWRRSAHDSLWFRVVEDSVSFDGTAAPVSAPASEQEAIDRITRQLRALLKTRFAPRPQRVSSRFRRGSMRSLNVGPGHSAVAIPVEGTGQLASVDQVVLEGHDFGVALSAQYVLSQVQPVLDHLKATFVQHLHFHHVTSLGLGPFSVDVLTIDLHYTVRLDSAWAEWSAGTVFGVPAGLLTVHISGAARTQNSDYDVTFDVTQQVMVTFDAAVEGLQLAPAGPPSVNVDAAGLFGGALELFAEPRIRSEVAAQVQNVLGQAAGQFNLASRKGDLIALLRTIDDHADAYFEDARFSPDGMVLLGRIPLAPRRRPVVTFEKTAQGDGYSAYLSWFPGGRIDRFDWSWSWSAHTPGVPGSEAVVDRFLLRRPGGELTRFGFFTGLETPLPGLDGWGTVCLRLAGVQVNPYTGALEQLQTDRSCTRFGWHVEVAVADDVGRLLLRDSEDGTETGLVGVGGQEVSGGASNLLVVHVGERGSGDVGAALEEGLRACERKDAGLVVLVLFSEGVLGSSGRDPAGELRNLAEKLEAPLVVNEDVRGAWSATLAIPAGSGEPSWRLISPAGGIVWMHDGPVDPKDLAKALDGGLFPSPPPAASLVRPAVDVGDRVSGVDLVEGAPGECPPPPVGPAGALDVDVVFVQDGSAASKAQLRHLSGDGRTSVVAVVDGATPDQAERLVSGLGEEVIAIADPRGQIAARFGISYWPTTVSVNELGVVTAHQVGLDPEAHSKEQAT